jgi:hypothetical protein
MYISIEYSTVLRYIGFPLRTGDLVRFIQATEAQYPISGVKGETIHTLLVLVLIVQS